MFNTIPNYSIPNYTGVPLALPSDSIGIYPEYNNTIPPQQYSFGEANTKLLEEQLMYQQILNEILYSSSLYTGWDNIPIFNVPQINYNLFSQNNYKSNPFNYNLDDYLTDSSNFNTSLIEAGYDFTKGQKLANIAKKNATGFRGQCATESKTSIQEAGLGKYVKGHAFQCDAILDKNPNFKRVTISLKDLKKTPGIVLVYKQGVSGYSSKYGHIEITGGDGCAYSDGKTRNIRPGYIAYAPVSKTSKSYTA